MFFVFDGIDGAGKTTQIELFIAWLAGQGHDVVACQDPGSTELGQRLRSVLLGKHQIPISMRAEMMLFTTARTQLIQEVVKPALAAGKTVVLDRYITSTIVYQGHAGDLDPADIRTVNHIATEGILPNVTFILDLPVDLALERVGAAMDRMESRGAAYLQRVREGFLQEAGHWPTGFEVIDASLSPATMHQEISTLATGYLKRRMTGIDPKS